MKLFTHEFVENNIAIINGEVVEIDPTIYKAVFSLTTKSLLMFEEEYGKPLLSAMTALVPKANSEDYSNMIDAKLIRALACSCYIKVDNGKLLINETTKMEFKNSPMNELCLTDMAFINQILALAMECLSNATNSASNGANGARDKKK